MLHGGHLALANFCGTEQYTITQLLNKIRDCGSITNNLPKSLQPYVGKESRLITNDPHRSLYVIDELCHAILEYYAVDARKYKGKVIAIENYRMVATSEIRVFIWSQRGYSPQTLSAEQMALLAVIPAMQEEAIAQLQAQVPATTKRTVKRYWGNVARVITYLKEVLRS